MSALDGLVVLDFTHAAAGPFCTMLLSDFGARIVKVEKPGRGDGARYMNMTEEMTDPVEGAEYFQGLNRNKESVAIDLSRPEGLELAEKLMSKADVVVENFRPGTMDRLGLGYERARELNPLVIYCQITAFGTKGPLAQEPGMDIVAQARAGTIAITGEPGGMPIKPGPSLADLSTGLQAAFAILLALQHREKAGEGQKIELSLLDGTLLMLSNFAVGVMNTGAVIEPMGSGHPQLAPYQAYRTSDGWVFIGCGTNSLWKRFCRQLELEAIVEDPRFSSNQARVRNKAELNSVLEEKMRVKTTDEWLVEMQHAGVPAAPIRSPGEAFKEQEALGSPIVQTVEHPTFGLLKLPGISMQLSQTPGRIRSHPPRLGENTYDVLSDLLGIEMSVLEQLERSNVVSTHKPAGGEQ